MSASSEFFQEIEDRIQENPDRCRRIGATGFIELEDTWGDETTILNTARISTSRNRLKPGQPLSEKDRNLLRDLLVHQHGTPFETVYFRFRFIAPIFVLRQWVKHRVSSWNEFSLRYRQPIDVYWEPEPHARQVSGFEIMDEEALASYQEKMQGLFDWYRAEYRRACDRIEQARQEGLLPLKEEGRDPYRGRARELLRSALPLSTYSDVYWTINFRSLLNFFRLRCKSGAQLEIQEYALAAYDLFAHHYPVLAGILEEEGLV